MREYFWIPQTSTVYPEVNCCWRMYLKLFKLIRKIKLNLIQHGTQIANVEKKKQCTTMMKNRCNCKEAKDKKKQQIKCR